VYEDTFVGSMGPVKLNIMMQPAHVDQEERHARILKQSLDHFERWYGPYPYKTLTLVDPKWTRPPKAWSIPPSSPAARIGGCRKGSICPRWSSSMNSATSIGMAWSPPTNSKTPGWTKASTATPK